MQSAEHGNGLDAAFCFARPWDGLLLGESLVLSHDELLAQQRETLSAAAGCATRRTVSPSMAAESETGAVESESISVVFVPIAIVSPTNGSVRETSRSK